MAETKTVWVAYTNTDLTEGRGSEIPFAICEIAETAHRLGKGSYVQGTDCPVHPMELVKLEGKWYVPSAAIQVIPPSAEDIRRQERRDARSAALAKARAAGLSEADLAALGVKV